MLEFIVPQNKGCTGDHNFVYANQEHENDGWASSENLKSLISGIDGLDTDSFNECLVSKKYEQRINDNKKIASDL